MKHRPQHKLNPLLLFGLPATIILLFVQWGFRFDQDEFAVYVWMPVAIFLCGTLGFMLYAVGRLFNVTNDLEYEGCGSVSGHIALALVLAVVAAMFFGFWMFIWWASSA